MQRGLARLVVYVYICTYIQFCTHYCAVHTHTQHIPIIVLCEELEDETVRSLWMLRTLDHAPLLLMEEFMAWACKGREGA